MGGSFSVRPKQMAFGAALCTIHEVLGVSGVFTFLAGVQPERRVYVVGKVYPSETGVEICAKGVRINLSSESLFFRSEGFD